MKVRPFSTLYEMCDIEPEDAQYNVGALFQATDVDTIVAILTHRPDGGMIGSTHLIKHRTH